MKQNTNFQVWETKKDEKFECLYVRKYSYPWTFKINYYDFTNIIILIADVTSSKGGRNVKPRRPDSACKGLQNEWFYIKIRLQEQKLALRER